MGLVAYTDPQGVFNKNESLVQKHLGHMKNLYWRPDMMGSTPIHSDETLGPYNLTRTIQHLDLKISPDSGQKIRRHQIPGLNNSPLVQILVIETTSLDIYRGKLRQIGKDWLNSTVQIRDPTGFVVVHVLNSDESPKARKAIWNRLTSEFEAGNCVQLSLSDQDDWSNLQHAVRTQLINAFGLRVGMLCQEIRKLRATQDVPGWNFGALFAVYESLAWAYSSMNLLEDALRVYEHLRTLTSQIPRAQWDNKTQVCLATDSTTNLTIDLSISQRVLNERDSLIDLTLAQKASYFNIQCYMLEREVSLLLRVALTPDFTEVMADNHVYESTKLVLIRLPLLKEQLESSIGKRSALTWLIKAVREIYSIITEVGSPNLSKGKGDLKLVERDYLQELGELNGCKIPGVFNEISFSNWDNVDDSVSSVKNNNPENSTEVHEFAELQSSDAYLREFIRLTQVAINYYQNAHSNRFVMGLTAQIMLIEFHRGNYKECWEYYENNPKVTQLSQQPLIMILDVLLTCAKNLQLNEQTLDLAWMVLVLETVPLGLFERAVEVINQNPSKTESFHNLSWWFIPKLLPYVRGDSNGYYLEVRLIPKRPNFPFFEFDKVKLVAQTIANAGHETKNLVFEGTKAETLGASGMVYKLYTRTFVEGTMEISQLDLFHNNNCFSHNFGGNPAAMKPLATAFNAHITLAKNHNMKKRNIDLKIRSPHMIQHATVHLKPIDPQLQLLLDKVEGAEKLTQFRDAIIHVPVLVNYDVPNLRVRVIIEYDKCSYEFYEHLNFALAVSVDFQESFRQPPRILSQFLVKPSNQVPTKFVSAVLTGSSNYEIDDFATNHNTKEMVAYNNAPISYVFSISKREKKNNSPKQSTMMQLSLEYRSLLWECQYLLLAACELKLGHLKCYQPTLSRIIEHLSSEIDLAEYLCSNEIRLKDVQAVFVAVTLAFEYMDPTHCKEMTDLIVSVLEDQKFDIIEPNKALNSTMQLEVPDPDADVVHYVDLRLKEESSMVEKSSFMVGEAISAILEINTVTFQSGALEDRRFEYELDRVFDGWSYTGRVKGRFIGGSSIKETLSLIPNRSGELSLPNVLIKSIDVSEPENANARDGLHDDSTNEYEEEEQIVVSKHANTRILIVPEINMLAISF